MTHSDLPEPVRFNSAWATIMKAGLAAGTCDITAASIQYLLTGGKSVAALLQFVASGVFGQSAFGGGLAMAGWGLLFHYGIALSFATFFFIIYRSYPRVRIHHLVLGVLYGVFVWVVMNLLVLPLSNAPALSFSVGKFFISLIILVVAVGLPISWIVTKHFDSK